MIILTATCWIALLIPYKWYERKGTQYTLNNQTTQNLSHSYAQCSKPGDHLMLWPSHISRSSTKLPKMKFLITFETVGEKPYCIMFIGDLVIMQKCEVLFNSNCACFVFMHLAPLCKNENDGNVLKPHKSRRMARMHEFDRKCTWIGHLLNVYFWFSS